MRFEPREYLLAQAHNYNREEHLSRVLSGGVHLSNHESPWKHFYSRPEEEIQKAKQNIELLKSAIKASQTARAYGHWSYDHNRLAMLKLCLAGEEKLLKEMRTEQKQMMEAAE